MLNIIIFQFIASFFLKALAVKSQVLATPFAFHINNFLLSLGKIFLLPLISGLSNITLALAVMLVLSLANVSYIFTIFAMILVNIIVIKIYSSKNKMDYIAANSFSGKIGSLLGILSIPLIKIISNSTNNYVFLFMGSMFIVQAFRSLVLNDLITSKVKECETNHRNILGFKKIKNAVFEYKDIVLLYILISFFSYFTSNIAFFSGSSRSAIAPCLAMLALVFKKYNKTFSIISILFAGISLYINSIPIYLLTICTGFLNISTKTYSRNKYKDAYIPHLTACFVVDILFAIFHIFVALYWII